MTSKITLGEMRNPEGAAAVRGLRCDHMVRLAPAKVDRWPDDMRPSDLEPQFTCSKCGHRRADVRPDFDQPTMGTSN